MPRSVEITVPASRTDRVLARVQAVEGLIGLKLHRGVSLEPPGDVIQLEATGRSMPALLRVLEELGVGAGPECAISTNEPVTVISPSSSEAILRDDPESPWEEMQVQIARESNMSPNGILLMAASGLLAAVGILRRWSWRRASSRSRGSPLGWSPARRTGAGVCPIRRGGTRP